MHKIKRNNFINMKMSSLKDTYKKKKKVNDYPLLTNKEPNLQK